MVICGGCRRVPLAAPGYDPSQPRNADGEWTAGGGKGVGGASGAAAVKPTDYEELAKSVTPERVAEITSGDYKSHCKIEEALAALAKNPKVKSMTGEEVTFGSDMGLKYLKGRGRPGNKPDPARLKELPIAMYAVKHDPNPKLQYLAGAIHDPMNPPRGTQKQYTTPASGGPMIARAWADSGKVTSWYVETKKPAPGGTGAARGR